MSGLTSWLEVLRPHIGGARGPDAAEAVVGLDLADVDVLAEALLSSLPRPVDDVPAYEAWPLVNARASLMSAGGAVIRRQSGLGRSQLDGGDEPSMSARTPFHQRATRVAV